MSKSAISVSGWAELNEAQQIECVSAGRATLKQMVEGLLDGPAKLREACVEFLSHSDAWLEKTQTESGPAQDMAEPPEQPPAEDLHTSNESHPDEPQSALLDNARKRRQGLPEGYVPPLHRH